MFNNGFMSEAYTASVGPSTTCFVHYQWPLPIRMDICWPSDKDPISLEGRPLSWPAFSRHDI